MLIAKSGHTNLDLVAGAIIAGIYFGDRCSPLSSSASLVATISLTNLFDNIKNMLRTSWLALLVSTLAYGALSLIFPLNHLSHTLLGQLNAQFIVAWPLLLPAAVILILSLFKRPLVESITVSILLAIVLGLHYQQTSWLKLGRAVVLGVQAGHGQLIGGGGLISMVTPLTIVFLSCCISGILNHLTQLKQLEHRLTQTELTPRLRFGLTAAMALMTSAIGCNQSVAIIMTNTLIKNNYQHQNNALAVELENTSVLLAPIVPWNIAVFVPISILGTSFIGYLPYAFFPVLGTDCLRYFFTSLISRKEGVTLPQIPTLDLNKTAYVAIDLQDDILNAPGIDAAHRHAVLTANNQLADYFKNTGALIVQVTVNVASVQNLFPRREVTQPVTPNQAKLVMPIAIDSEATNVIKITKHNPGAFFWH
ncbi:Na+/H+ antiporter NhaC family protein [Secundilactobacillus odoratitofui]|uniref:Na+/H+ antiporter NhaC family protein n=1 Tax=Secundilactobacillus odoratitofui TaxID=480930 RepID=UPI0034E2FC51